MSVQCHLSVSCSCCIYCMSYTVPLPTNNGCLFFEFDYAELLLWLIRLICVLDWKGSPAGRDQWLCWPLHDTEGKWLCKGNVVQQLRTAKQSTTKVLHSLPLNNLLKLCKTGRVPYVLKLKAFTGILFYIITSSEQGQTWEAARPGRGFLPQAGSLSHAFCLGNC